MPILFPGKCCVSENAILKVIPMNDNGELLIGEYEKLFSPKTRIVSLLLMLQIQ
jgi:selenocysteine lyase/cysteine desulfurase